MYCLKNACTLPAVNTIALLAGPAVLLWLLLRRFLRRPFRLLAERLRLEDGIPMVFSREGAEIPKAALEAAAARAVRRFFKQALECAVALRAADLLSEPLPDGGSALRIRVGGSLRTLRKLSSAEAGELLRLIEFLTGNDPELNPHAESTVEFRGRQGGAALRIGTLKVAGGTRICLHLLRPERSLETPADLGLDADQTAALRGFFALRGGMIVIAGESGSGRSLALERLLDLANLKDRSAILVSPSTPVRLRPDVMRIGGSDGGEATADAALSALQQSPDLLAVDEVNDRTLLAALLKAAGDNRLTVAVIRARSLVETLSRLLTLGASGAELAALLRLVIQLHPLRGLCRCAKPALPTPEESAFLNAAGLSAERLRDAAGCPACASSGYRGRTAAFELYTPGDAMCEALRAPQPPSPAAIRAVLEQELGPVSAYTAGCRTAALGLTSLAEAATLRQPTTQEFRG